MRSAAASTAWPAALLGEQKPDLGLLSFASLKELVQSDSAVQQDEQKKTHTHTPLHPSSVFKEDKLKRTGWECAFEDSATSSFPQTPLLPMHAKEASVSEYRTP